MRVLSSCALASAVVAVGGLLSSVPATAAAPAASAADAPTAAAVTSLVAGLSGDVEDPGPGLPSEVPSAITPWIDDDSAVRAFVQVGNTMVAGGRFDGATGSGGSPAYARTHVLAFDATTGAVSTTFAPELNGQVESLIAGPLPGTVYVAGGFTTVDGTNRSKIALLDVATGALNPTFRPVGINGTVNSIDRIDNRLFVGGTFTRVGGVDHAGLATLNATTGALDPYLNVQVAENHNNTGSGAQGAVGVRKLDITPAGDRLVAVGNFRTADGLPRDQVVVVTLDPTQSYVTPDWNTYRYNPYCFKHAYDSVMRDMSLSPDGSFFVIGATGGHNAGTLCDTAARFETYATGDNLQPTWAADSGGDTLWGIGVSESAVYVGGHQRWMNNPYGSDFAAQGAVPRAGMAALDPQTGVPLDWNPGRNPRGVSAFAMFPTEAGLWMGSDTLWVGDRRYRRPRIAFFPYAGGRPTASKQLGELPGDVVLGGASTSAGVLYRVNAGGPSVTSVDAGPDWAADDQVTSPWRNVGSNAAGWDTGRTLDATVPATTPPSVFDSERWDPVGGDELQWDFAVPAGQQVQVRLYFANRCDCTAAPGQRRFDVSIDGSLVLDDLDLAGQVGHDVATMRAFTITSDGTVDIDLAHVFENPLINAIEIVDPATFGQPSPSAASVRYLDGDAVAHQRTVATPDLDWSTVRGAVMIGQRLFYGQSDGFLYRRSFDGSDFGPAVQINPYNDPAWADVDSGSNSTFNGRVPDLYGRLARVTGMAYTQGKLFYTLRDDNTLYWQLFSPDSGIVEPVLRSMTGSLAWSQARGMFVGGDDLYVATADGALSRIDLTADGFPTGAPTAVSSPSIDGQSWLGRALFLATTEPVLPNVEPTAAFTDACVHLECAFDAGGSTDPDGSIASYAWDFGDGATSQAPAPSHTYRAAGTYPVSLTVTDDEGASDTVSRQVAVQEPPNQAPSADFTDSCLGLECGFDAGGSADPDGTLVDYAWDFGDGTSGSGATVTHEYAADSAYEVTLTVTDDDGATDTATRTIEVAEIGQEISHVASTATTGNLVTHTVTTPAGVQAGDRLLLFVTVARSASVQAPAGWTQVGSQDVGTMSSRLFSTVATTASAGSTVDVQLDARSKATLGLSAYRGASTTIAPVVASAGDNSSGSARTSPVVEATSGAWVVTAWGDKSASTSGWTPPGGTPVRTQSAGSAAAHSSLLVVDSGGPVPSGPYGGLVATSDGTGVSATAVSVVLAASDGSQPANAAPTAALTSTCLGLDCTFDAAGSTDPDGTIVSYDWSVDGVATSGASVQHSFPAEGAYDVTLTVTDDRGGVDTVNESVEVGAVAPVDFVDAVAQTRNAASQAVTVPAGVQAGDRLVLFVSANRSATTFGDPTSAAWSQLGSQTVKTMSTRVWTAVADAQSAGATVTVTFDATTKSTLQLVVYRGATGTPMVAGAADPANAAERLTPVIDAPAGSVVLSYWADKSATTTGWTLPAGVTYRSDSAGSGAGHTTSVIADSGGPVPSGPYGGLVATSSDPSGMAVSFTVALGS